MQESERAIYHDIVNSSYKIFTKERPYAEFSDAWWEGLLSDYDDLRAKYRGTDYQQLVDELTFQLQEQQERRQKNVVQH